MGLHAYDCGPARGKARRRPVFIRSAGYGTRCSTVLLVGTDGTVRFKERTTGGGVVAEVFVLDR